MWPAVGVKLGFAATYASWRGRRWDIPRRVMAGSVELVVAEEESRWPERGKKAQASPSYRSYIQLMNPQQRRFAGVGAMLQLPRPSLACASYSTYISGKITNL